LILLLAGVFFVGSILWSTHPEHHADDHDVGCICFSAQDVSPTTLVNGVSSPAAGSFTSLLLIFIIFVARSLRYGLPLNRAPPFTLSY
jgi:hypothetical protein